MSIKRSRRPGGPATLAFPIFLALALGAPPATAGSASVGPATGLPDGRLVSAAGHPVLSSVAREFRATGMDRAAQLRVSSEGSLSGMLAAAFGLETSPPKLAGRKGASARSPLTVAADLALIVHEISARLASAAPAAGSRPSGASLDAARGIIDIAAAIDASLPTFLARSRAVGPGARPVVGCDLINRRPDLCVGGTGDNTYTEDVALLVDLGGRDVYLNSAGGAAGSHTSGLLASINIDLSGDDRYLCQTEPSPSVSMEVPTLRVCQGAGGVGAVGLLVDVSGDDVYTAASPDGLATGLVAQGAGYGGFGGLLDLDGNDRYVAEFGRSDSKNDPTHSCENEVCPYGVKHLIYAQGAGGGGARGVAPAAAGGFSELIPLPGGLLDDTGTGDDSYYLDGGTVGPCDDTCGSKQEMRLIVGQGGANGGRGVHVDDGGRDDYAATVGVNETLADQPSYVSHVYTLVQGAGRLGAGDLIQGSGPTSYSLEAATFGRGEEWLYGQGAGQGLYGIAGIGRLHDFAGDDSYSTAASAMVARALDPRQCDLPEGCPINVNSGRNRQIVAQGAGFAVAGPSAGQLVDYAGDDAYVATSRHSLSAQVLPEGGFDLRVSAVTVLRLDFLVAQGAGATSTIGAPVGILEDLAGGDQFRLNGETVVHASSVRPHDVTTATASRPWVVGQGGAFFGGSGTLVDNGTSSRIEARSAGIAETGPGGEEERLISPWWPRVQGSADVWSTATIVAAGLDSELLSSPSNPVCDGMSRGFDAWAECPNDSSRALDFAEHGIGVALRTRPGEKWGLSLEAVPSGDSGHVTLRALLTDGGGNAVDGKNIHFDLRSSAVADTLQEVATNSYTLDGAASATLPVPPDGAFEVYATFDGAPGVKPVHAMLAFDDATGPS